MPAKAGTPNIVRRWSRPAPQRQSLWVSVFVGDSGASLDRACEKNSLLSASRRTDLEEMKIPKTGPDLPSFYQLPSDQETRIRKWLDELGHVERPLQEWFERVGRVMGCSWQTVRSKYYRLKKSGDWHVLVNYACLPCEDKAHKRFVEWWRKLYLQHKSGKAAYRRFLHLFNTNARIPGLPRNKGRESLPSGFGYSSLITHAPTEFERGVILLGKMKPSRRKRVE